MGTTEFFCVFCGRLLEETEYSECVECADSGADFEEDDFMWGRRDMETDEEYAERLGTIQCPNLKCLSGTSPDK